MNDARRNSALTAVSTPTARSRYVRQLARLFGSWQRGRLSHCPDRQKGRRCDAVVAVVADTCTSTIIIAVDWRACMPIGALI